MASVCLQELALVVADAFLAASGIANAGRIWRIRFMQARDAFTRHVPDQLQLAQALQRNRA